MFPSKRMFKHRWGLSKSFGSQIDPEKSEELKRTKTDIETNLSRIVKLIKNEEQSKKEGNFESRKEKELVGLIEDFYNQYQSLYGRLTGEYVKAAPCIVGRLSSVSSSSSESDYFSSEEVDINDSNQKPFFRERERSTLEEQVKRSLELQVESQACQVKQLCAKNAELHNRVLELQLLLKESKGTVSVLQANKDQATSQIAQLMARINKLEQEAKSLRTQKAKMEDKLKRNKNKALSQKKDFTDQINVMQQKLDSVSNHNKELEAREREQVSQCLVRIENLRENSDEMTSAEKECFLAKIKDLEPRVESRNHELERAMAQRREEISELVNCKEGAFTHAKALQAQVEKLTLELQNERSEKENMNAELESRVRDQEKTIKKLTESITQIVYEIWSKNMKSYHCQRLSQREMEGDIRLLHQRIHVAEPLNNENKESCKVTKERYEEENKRLGERIASYEDEPRVRATTPLVPIEVNLDGLELGALDLAAGKLEEHRERVLGLVSKMLGEVKFAKDWKRERKGEMKELKEKVDCLTVLLREKEEKELLLREKVWKLEANVSKEGGEKLNLIKAVRQLERKLGKLENNLKEKDEELIGLGEKKREAIRQLCFLIEFHRDRCVYLKNSMPKRRVRAKK